MGVRSVDKPSDRELQARPFNTSDACPGLFESSVFHHISTTLGRVSPNFLHVLFVGRTARYLNILSF